MKLPVKVKVQKGDIYLCDSEGYLCGYFDTEEEAEEIAKRINEYEKIMNDYCYLARENTRLTALNRELMSLLIQAKRMLESFELVDSRKYKEDIQDLIKKIVDKAWEEADRVKKFKTTKAIVVDANGRKFEFDGKELKEIKEVES